MDSSYQEALISLKLSRGANPKKKKKKKSKQKKKDRSMGNIKKIKKE